MSSGNGVGDGAMDTAGELITPSQTVGPFFAMRLPWADGPFVVPEGTPARLPSPAGSSTGPAR